MFQALLLNKRGSFNNITDWPSFKARLIDEFGSVDIFGCETNHGVFNFLPQYEPVQEVAEDLTLKIKTLKANLEIVKKFHVLDDLYSVTLTHILNSNIIRSLPNKLRSSFNDQYMTFWDWTQVYIQVKPKCIFKRTWDYLQVQPRSIIRRTRIIFKRFLGVKIANK